MAPLSVAPVSSEIGAAFAHFFHGGAGPRHSAITRVLTENGYSDDYQYGAKDSPNKENRVLSGFAAARRAPARGRAFVDGLLGLLRLDSLIGTDANSQEEVALRRALRRGGWDLTREGELFSIGAIDLNTGGREALEEQLQRLRNANSDPGLLLGTAKELLESVAKFVLEEHGWSMNSQMDFGHLWHLARERLGILPQQVSPDLPGSNEIRQIHQSTWDIAKQVNALRNLQGTGHGRTLPTGVSADLAFLVVREACTVSEYMLSLLERSHGRH